MSPNLNDPGSPSTGKFIAPLTPEQSVTCYVDNSDTVADFRSAYYDKKPITVVFDNTDGSKTERY
jgi:hypothetical protein